MVGSIQLTPRMVAPFSGTCSTSVPRQTHAVPSHPVFGSQSSPENEKGSLFFNIMMLGAMIFVGINFIAASARLGELRARYGDHLTIKQLAELDRHEQEERRKVSEPIRQ